MEFVANTADVAAAHAPRVEFSDYTVLDFVQKGGWGTVYSARRNRDGKRFAMKFFGYTERQPGIADIASEISLMMSLKGISGVIQLEGVFNDTAAGLIPGKNRRFLQPYLVIVMEMVEGGELYTRIEKRATSGGVVTERYIAKMFRSAISALDGIHSRRYIHRDLKLDNLLLTSDEDDSQAKIIDFGLMVRLEPGQTVFRGPRSGTAGSDVVVVYIHPLIECQPR
jgi:serine/threonine protein kinase